MVGAHVCDPPMALEGPPLCNEAFQAHHEGFFVHTASAGLVHFHGRAGEEGVLQGGGDGTQAASHQQNKSL